jgi:site-specific DNA-methyltransferase (adenine-specific)
MKIEERNDHKLINARAIDGFKSINDKSVDLIFADPPYNLGKKYNGEKLKWDSIESYLNWCYEWIDICLKKLKPNGSIYLMNSTQNIPYIDIFLRKRIEILSRIIWSYDSSGVQAKNYFGSLYEPILHGVINKNNYTFNSDDILIEAKTGAQRNLIDYRKDPPQPYNTKKVPGNVWEIPRVRYRMDEYEKHPTQKPEKLLERIIKVSSNEGDIVLDPFSGTFTTCKVAQRLGRRSIGIEIQEEYFKIGLRRLGILEKYKGEDLKEPKKSYKRKKQSIEITYQHL